MNLIEIILDYLALESHSRDLLGMNSHSFLFSLNPVDQFDLPVPQQGWNPGGGGTTLNIPQNAWILHMGGAKSCK